MPSRSSDDDVEIVYYDELSRNFSLSSPSNFPQFIVIFMRNFPMSSISDNHFVDFVGKLSIGRHGHVIDSCFTLKLESFILRRFFFCILIILIIFEGNLGFVSHVVFIADLPKRHEARMQIYSLVSSINYLL